MGRSTKRRFEYQEPSVDAAKKRSKEGSGVFDRLFKDEFSVFSIVNGNEHLIRILPATWDNADLWSYKAFVHFGVGPDNSTYLCLKQMKGKECPVCDVRNRAQMEGDTDYAKSLAPKSRAFVWLIDRDNESEGPLLWNMPQSVDKEISNKAFSKKTRSLLRIDKPENGYDISFTRVSKGSDSRHVDYEGLDIARDESPISDDGGQMDDWLDFIVDNPISEVLNFYSYDHINGHFSGQSSTEQEEDPLDDGRDDPPWSDEEDKDAEIDPPVEEDPYEDDSQYTEEPEEEKAEEPRRRSRRETRETTSPPRGRDRVRGMVRNRA